MSAPARSGWSRARRLALRAAAVAAVLCGAVYLFRGALFGRLVADEITQALSEELGGSYSIRAVEGDWITGVVLVGLRTETEPPDGMLREIGFERAAIGFSWTTVRDDALRAITDLDIDGLRIVLGRNPEEVADDASSGPDLAEVLAAIPRPLPRLDVRGRVLAHTASGEWVAERVRIEGGGTAVRVAFDDVAPPLEDADGPWRLRGAVDWADPDVVRWTSDEDFGGVTPSALTGSTGSGGASRLDAKVAVAGGTVEGTVTSSGFRGAAAAIDVAKLPPWLRALAGGSPSAFPARGRLDARFDGDSDRVHAALDASGLGWTDRAVDRLVADATWQDRLLSIATLDAAGEGVTATARDVVLDPASPLLVVRAGELTASTPDAAALAVRLGHPEFASRMPPQRCAASVRLRSAGPREVRIDELRFEAQSSRAAATGGATLPEDPKDWRTTVLRLEATAAVSLDDVRRAAVAAWMPEDSSGRAGLAVRVEGEAASPRVTGTLSGAALRLGGQRVDRLALTGTFAGGVVTVTSAELAAPFADVRGRGVAELDPPRVREAVFEIDARDLAAASRAFPALPALRGALNARGNVAGAPAGGWTGDAVVKADGLAADAWEIGALAAEGRIEGTRATIGRLTAAGPLGSFETSGRIDVSSGAFDLPALRATLPDVRAVAQRIAGAPPLEGSLSFEGSVAREAGAPWREITASVRASGADFVVEGVRFTAWEIEADARRGHVGLRRLASRGDLGTVRLAGETDLGASSARGTLRECEIERGGRTASLAAPAAVTWTDGTLDVGSFEAEVAGVGRVRGAARLGEGRVAASLAASELDLSFLGERAGGRAAVRLVASGSASAPELRLDVEAPRATFDGEPVSVSAALAQTAQGIRLDRLAVDAGDLLRADGEGHIPLRLGADGLVHVASPAAPRLRLRIESANPGRWSKLVTGEALSAQSVGVTVEGDGRDLDVQARLRDLHWTDARGERLALVGDTTLRIAVGDAGTTVGVESAAGGLVSLRGELRSPASPDWTDPARFLEASGDAAIEGSLELATADVSPAERWLAGVRQISGRARGRVEVSGTVGAPQWAGRVDVEDVTFLMPGDVAPIDRGTARLRLEGRRVVIESLEARLGHGPVTLTGDVDFEAAGSPRVNARLVGRNVLVVRSHHLRLRADVDVRVSGALDAASIAGTARVTRARYTRPMDILGRGSASPDQSFQLFSLRDPPFAAARLDVAVTADRTVRVESDLVQADVSLDVRLRGTGEVPEPSGWVTFHDAKVTLPFTTLEVERGRLEFQPGHPFTPRIRAVARAAVKGFDLDVVLSGNLPDAEVHVASSPPLSQSSARLLLATGATPLELEREGIAGAALSRAGTLLGGAALSWIGGRTGARGPSILDRVRVEVGREESEEGVKTVSAEFRMAERWYLVAERDRYEDYDLGIVWRLRFR